MIFRHKKLVAMLALVVQGLGGVAAKAGAAEASAETVVISGFSRKKAGSDSELSTETGVETGPASRTVPRAVKLGIPLVGGAALLEVLAAFVGHKLFSSGKSIEGVETNPVSSSLSLVLDLEGKPFDSLNKWAEFLIGNFSEAGKHILVCGPSGSGKKKLLQRLIFGTYSDGPQTTIPSGLFGLGIRTNSTFFQTISGFDILNPLVVTNIRQADLIVLLINGHEYYSEYPLYIYVDQLTRFFGSLKPIILVISKFDSEDRAADALSYLVYIQGKIESHEWFLYTASAKTGESNLIGCSVRRPS